MTLAEAMAILPPASLDDWFRCTGAPAVKSVKRGDLMVLRKVHEMVEGTVATVVESSSRGDLTLERRIDGSPLKGPFSQSSLTWPGGPLGFTLLHAAAALKCSGPVISALLEGQSAAATDALGRTPLAVAIQVIFPG